MARSTPIIHSNRLFYGTHEDEAQIFVGSPEWYAWLDTATSFAFHDAHGSFTARRERTSNKRGGWYWKAYSRRAGKLRHAYLGKTETLTLERLHAVSTEFAHYTQKKTLAL